MKLNDSDRAWSTYQTAIFECECMFKKWKNVKLKSLVKIAEHACTDSHVETLIAYTWPSRSLLQDHRNHVLQHFESNEWDSDFLNFDPLASSYIPLRKSSEIRSD